MRCLGKLLVIWGGLLPVLTFPWMRGFHWQLGVLGSLEQMHFVVLEGEVSYAAVVTLGLGLVGLGMSYVVLAEEGERLMRRDPHPPAARAPSPGAGEG
ncbi:hypothetical protein [Azospirillum sp.]|uniref:hypothetical protein n=1 Tax=Azospirillum sp. TaxID=34012 RepID=UPI002D5FA3CA|nr:hypothetical protein [Azospirillum sp.]HYD64801.1 hypothetical protein [Azospirillum sp.]